MIKVYSIKEIVDATNSILEGKNELPENNQKKIEKDEIIETKIIKNNHDEVKPLLLKEEWIEKKTDQKEKIKKVETNSVSRNYTLLSLAEQKEKKNNQKIIDEIYKIINKKVRKSTIKVILDQQTEINDLKEKISTLRKFEYKNLRINKKLKNEISTLIENEKILSFKFKELNEKLNTVTENKNEFIKKNEELEKKLTNFIKRRKY